jgi:hypothetical protein
MAMGPTPYQQLELAFFAQLAYLAEALAIQSRGENEGG